MSKEIDLERFCGSDPDPKRHQWISRPFSIGAWTYATNGHVMVRIPRRPDIPENPEAPARAPELFDEVPKSRMHFLPAPKFELPAPHELESEVECEDCCGGGKAHACPDCRHPCSECDGKGSYTEHKVHRTTIGRAAFNSTYIGYLQELPSLELAKSHVSKPMAFRFKGGQGLLMPLGGHP